MNETGFSSPQDALDALERNLDGAPEGDGILSWFRTREQEFSTLGQKIVKQRIDFSTVIEIANQVNAKGLDLKRIEGYVISMLRGQFGVLHAFLMRQAHPDDENLVVTAPPKLAKEDIGFPLDSPAVQRLVDASRPLPRDEYEPWIEEEPAFSVFLENKAQIVVPLIHSAAKDGQSLKGVMAVGPRLTGLPFSQADCDLLSVLGDMIAISIHNAQLYHRSIVDGLTKVFSRGHFDVHLFQEISRARRYIQREENQLSKDEGSNKYVSLAMVDIDHFKKFNDTYGHQVGDRVLRSVAGVLHDAVRNMDIVARYGGEEFALVFPETQKKDAMAIAERLRQSVSEIPISEETGDDAKITISLGVATFPGDAEDMRELVNRADVALYEAKNSGRNRVCSSTGRPK
jgi:diguanylate cyclase (GGDEF)-like protein